MRSFKMRSFKMRSLNIFEHYMLGPDQSHITSHPCIADIGCGVGQHQSNKTYIGAII